jgi:ankyrin repeat protein
MVSALVARGATVDWKGEDQRSPLAVALARGNDEVARCLIVLGPPIKGLYLEKENYLLLLWFLRRIMRDKERMQEPKKYLEMLGYMLDKGADVNQMITIGSEQETVFSSVLGGSFKFSDNQTQAKEEYGCLSGILNVIIEKIDFNISQNRLIVNTVVKRNDERLVDMLVKAGAPINESDEKDGNTPLHLAVLSGSLSIISKLLENNANMYLENKNKESAIQLAQKCSNNDILRKFATEIALKHERREISSLPEKWEEVFCSL